MNFFRLIGDFFNVSRISSRIKSDEFRRQKSVRFAITSMIFTLITVALALCGSYIIKISGDSALVIFLLVIGIALLLGALMTLVASLVRVIAQLGINKKPLGWVALAIFVLGTVASVVGAICILSAV